VLARLSSAARQVLLRRGGEIWRRWRAAATTRARSPV
jgi:hypothetical protein